MRLNSDQAQAVEDESCLVHAADDSHHAWPGNAQERLGVRGRVDEHHPGMVSDAVVLPIEVAPDHEPLARLDRESGAKTRRPALDDVGKGVEQQDAVVRNAGAVGNAAHLVAQLARDVTIEAAGGADQVRQREAFGRETLFDIDVEELADLVAEQAAVLESHLVVRATEEHDARWPRGEPRPPVSQEAGQRQGCEHGGKMPGYAELLAPEAAARPAVGQGWVPAGGG